MAEIAVRRGAEYEVKTMRITFISNYINHHQIPFSEEMYGRLGSGYCFIQTEPMEEERVRMGWAVDIRRIPYVRCYYEEKEQCDALLMESDIVICGWIEEESIIRPRLQTDRITIRCSERLYREGQWKAVSPRGLLRKYQDHTKYRNKNVYLLCCGGYVASDYQIVKAYPHKRMKWGYFPRFISYDIQRLMERKRTETESVNILWTGRFMELKHPEYAVEAAVYLRGKGYSFHMTMIGDGQEKERIQGKIQEEHLEEYITLQGFMRPEEVRKVMERADIFLFTSNHLEGWGAVLNESMNGGCAVVANHAIGAVPFLIQDGVNGLIYENGNQQEFLQCVEMLVKDKELCKQIGTAAYHTIANTWNAKTAAEAFYNMCTKLLQGELVMPEEGPCSEAAVLPPGKAYRILKEQRR